MSRESIARIALLSLTVLTTIVGATVFGMILFSHSISIMDVAQLLIFICLFALVAFSFWSVLAGLLLYPRPTTPLYVKKTQGTVKEKDVVGHAAPERVAICVPIYQEDPARVFAGVEATIRELVDAGINHRCDIFVLSDTRDTNIWILEERCWQEVLERNHDSGLQVYYRRRKFNKARKSGNIEDFVKRFGGSYDVMVIYDADSLMAGPTLKEMIARMDAEQDLGILQAPPRPVNRMSLFARLQQYAAAVYGPVFANGLRLWTENDGNYWGHNAAIRIKPFAEHCGLPVLPGTPPLGGEILSHDFVEAALMRKAGYKVRLAEDLDGSFEECPTTLIDFAMRDQRWCQGNLQHSALVAREGLHPISRAHMVMGILSFVAAPLWALFILFGVAGVLYDMYVIEQVPDVYTHWGWSAGVFIATMLMLLIPKLIGTIHATGRRDEKYNGFSLFFSTILEVVASVIVAPIFMAFHSRFVFTILAGRSVEWGPQQRTESGTAFGDAVNAHGLQTIAGIVLALIGFWLSPDLFLWLSPVYFGLIFSIPISMLISSQKLGYIARRLGLLIIPEEINVPRVIRRLNESEPHYQSLVDSLHDTDPLTHLLNDVSLLDLHLRVLDANPEYQRDDDEQLERECGLAYHGGSSYLQPADREKLMQSPASLRHLNHKLTGQTAAKQRAASRA